VERNEYHYDGKAILTKSYAMADGRWMPAATVCYVEGQSEETHFHAILGSEPQANQELADETAMKLAIQWIADQRPRTTERRSDQAPVSDNYANRSPDARTRRG
jgi:hypothetical protein